MFTSAEIITYQVTTLVLAKFFIAIAENVFPAIVKGLKYIGLGIVWMIILLLKVLELLPELDYNYSSRRRILT